MFRRVLHIIRNRKDGQRFYKCPNCGKRTWHKFVGNKKIIMVLNRSGGKKRGLLNRHYICVLYANEYYLREYSVFKCLKCGKNKNILGTITRISKEEAEKSDIEKRGRLAFWHLVHH